MLRPRLAHGPDDTGEAALERGALPRPEGEGRVDATGELAEPRLSLLGRLMAEQMAGGVELEELIDGSIGAERAVDEFAEILSG